MAKSKIAITLERTLLDQLDELVEQRRFSNRSQAIETAVSEKLRQMRHTRLLEALNDIDPAEEIALAEEHMEAAIEIWPEY